MYILFILYPFFYFSCLIKWHTILDSDSLCFLTHGGSQVGHMKVFTIQVQHVIYNTPMSVKGVVHNGWLSKFLGLVSTLHGVISIAKKNMWGKFVLSCNIKFLLVSPSGSAHLSLCPCACRC